MTDIILNKNTLSIGAKYLTNKEIDDQTNIQTEKYIDNHTNKYTNRQSLERKSEMTQNNSLIYCVSRK